MSRMIMTCNQPQFYKEIDCGDEVVTIDMIEAESLTRVRTLLGNGKVTVTANLYNENFHPKDSSPCQLYHVDVKMGNGVSFMGFFVRVYQPEESIA